ncbi:MAG: FKBP-type peptidyl-prolyl cis-trans isomerase [Bacteroidales bacterium]
MSKIIGLFILSLLLVINILCCTSHKEQLPKEKRIKSDRTQQLLQNINHYFSEKEYDILQQYMLRQNFKMQQSKYGFYVEQLSQGTGHRCSQRDFVTLHGQVWLIDGTLCYTYTAERPLQIHIGAETHYRALNLALLGVRKGDSFRILFPSMMLFGLSGDGNKIPPKSPLLFTLTVVDIIRK